MSSQEQLLELTQRVLNDEEVSDEEYATLIASLREDRSAGKSKTRKPKGSLPDDLSELFKS